MPAIHGFGESVKRAGVCKRKPTPGPAPEPYTTAPSTKGYTEAKTPHCETGSVQTPFSEPVSAFAASNSPSALSFTCLANIETFLFVLPLFPLVSLHTGRASYSLNARSFTQPVSTFVAFNPFSTCLTAIGSLFIRSATAPALQLLTADNSPSN